MQIPQLSNKRLNTPKQTIINTDEKLQIDIKQEDNSDSKVYSRKGTPRFKRDVTDFILNTPKTNGRVPKKSFQREKFLSSKGFKQYTKKIKLSFVKDSLNDENTHCLESFDKQLKDNKNLKSDLNHFDTYIQNADKKFKLESLNKHIIQINKGLEKSKNVLNNQRKTFIANVRSVKREKSKYPIEADKLVRYERRKTVTSKDKNESYQHLSVINRGSKKNLSLLKSSFKGQSDCSNLPSKGLNNNKVSRIYHRSRKSNEALSNMLKFDTLTQQEDSSRKIQLPVYKEHEFNHVFKIINFLEHDTDLSKQRLAIREKMKIMKFKSKAPHIEKYSDEKTFLNDFEILEVLGQGSYAKVKLLKNKNTGTLYAVKIYKKIHLEDEIRRENLEQEISIMASLDHISIVKLIRAVEAKNHIYLIMDFISKISLHDYIEQQNERLTELLAKKIFYQLIKGIEYIHAKSIVHRDLKLQNILIQHDTTVKIIDFGFACEDHKLEIFCGTPSYMAPEIVKRIPYRGKPADIWALGVILYKMLTGIFPFRASTESELYNKINKLEFNRRTIGNKNAADLLNSIFTVNPIKRPTAKDILKHAWFCDKNSTELSTTYEC